VNKNAYVTGSFSCSWTQFHTPASALFNSVGFRDAYLWKTSSSGDLEYVKTFGGNHEDMGHGVAIKPNGEAVICGSYTQNMHYPNTTGTTSLGNYTMNITPSTGNNLNYFSHGDASSNSFITNAIDGATLDYNFFVNTLADSLLGNIFPDLDTVHFCLIGQLGVNTKTFPIGGPAYDYVWSTGSTSALISLNTSGTYSVYWQRNDECSMDNDTIEVVIHQTPDLPTMTDNLGLAVNEPGSGYYNYSFCYPDSVNLWFNDLPDSTTITITSGNQQFYDTLPHTYYQSASISISTQYCNADGYFNISYDYPTPYAYDPYLVLEDAVDFNDSITVCANQVVSIQNLDYNNNPTGIFNLFPNQQPYQINWSITTNGLSVPHSFHFISNLYYPYFYAPATGWYLVNVQSTTGYNNLCGIDTNQYVFVDSFYVEVLPLPIAPSASITGDNLLCPNGSVYLVVNPTVSTYNWGGPGIEWISQNEDSVQVTTAGTYFYNGVVVNSTTGCTSLLSVNTFTLQEKQPPSVVSNPSDAVICPYDTVAFSIANIFVSYEWIGPQGMMPSTTNVEFGTEQGFYYVNVVDDEGCSLTSLPAELTEYSTPYLTVLPSNVICEGESATINVISFGDVIINWINPAASSANQITVNQAGWYVCEITQCGITVLDSVEIIDGTFSLSLNYSDSLLCYNQNIIVTTTPGLSEYQWNNPEVYGSSIIIQDAGAYYLTAINNYGCEATSDTAFFTSIIASEPPIIADTFTCISGVISILNDSPTNWYSIDSVLISAGLSFEPSIQSDTSFLVSYAPAECPVVFSNFQIDFIQFAPVFQISGDSIICNGDALNLTVNSTSETVNWILNGDIIGTNSAITISSNQIMSADSIFVVVISLCYTDTISYFFQQFTSQSLTLNQDLINLCEPEEIILTSIEGYSELIWTGSFGTENDSILLLDVNFPAGLVYAQGIDSNGCLTNMDSVEIAYVADVIPPSFDTITICEAGEVEITNLALINWYTSDSVFLENALSILVNVASDTSFLASFAPAGCPVQYSQVSIQIIQNIPQFEIFGDTLLCLGEDLELTTNASADSLSWIHNGFLVSNTTSVLISNLMLLNNDIISLIILNECYSDTIYQAVIVHTQQIVSLDFDTLILCPNDTELISVLESHPLVSWFDGINTYNSTTLELNTTNFSSGYIEVSAIDSNGCPTLSDNFLLSIPYLFTEITVDYGLNCIDDSIQFIANTTADSILWQTPFGNTTSDTINLVISDLTDGTYLLQSWDENGCLFSTETNFTAQPLPILNLPSDTFLCSSIDFPLVLSNSIFTFEWVDSYAPDSIINGISSWYFFTLNGTNGCVIQDSIYLNLANCADQLPNVFTPNGDGVNDYFSIDEALLYPKNQLIITNRWGQVVYETIGYRNDFGGQDLTDGVYYFVFHHDPTLEPTKYFEGFFHIIR